MRLVLYFLFLIMLSAPTSALADDERAARREARERREEVRLALRRVKKCFGEGEIDCFDRESQKMRNVLMVLYLKHIGSSKQADKEFLSK